MFITLIVTAITLILLFDYLIKRRRYDMTANLPGPKSYPLVGCALIYIKKSPQDIMAFIESNKNKYGQLYRVWIFNQLAIFSTNPKDLEIILSSTKHIEKNSLYDFLHTWLGEGLLLSTDHKWFSRRKIITPTFHFKILEQFVEVFDQQTKILVDKLNSKVDGEAFNIYPYITLAALDIISETAMGTKLNAQIDPDCEYVRAVADITDILAKRFINVFERMDWFYRLFNASGKKKQDQTIRVLHKFTQKIIEERRTILESSSKTNEASEDDICLGRKKKMALLDLLLQSTVNGKPLSNRDIQEEVDTFMFEGHDTTTAGICYTLVAISRHPEIQEKLYNEISDVIGTDSTEPITYRQLQDLKYTECVIKESMRLYPPVPLIGRRLAEDMDINGSIIPAGTNYTIGIYVMHKDPSIFPDPEKFDPERHTIEYTTEKSNPYSFIPFSAGPRNCIGQKFAMLEMKSFLARILQRYELLPRGADPDLVMNLVLRSSKGMNLGLRAR